jgi:RNA-binding protein YhbY
MPKSVNGCTRDQIKEIEERLQSRGFVKVDEFSRLQKGEYKITYFSGSAKSFGSDTKCNIERQE